MKTGEAGRRGEGKIGFELGEDRVQQELAK